MSKQQTERVMRYVVVIEHPANRPELGAQITAIKILNKPVEGDAK